MSEPSYFDIQPRLPMSGLLYMARLTHRPHAFRKWIEKRIGELKEERWPPKAICRLLGKEIQDVKWMEKPTDEGEQA